MANTNQSPPFNPNGQKPSISANPKGNKPSGSPPFYPGPGPRPIGPQPQADIPYPEPGTGNIPAPQGGGFDRDAFLRDWKARKQQRIPLNTTAGPGTLPPPMIKPGISQVPPGQRDFMDRSGGKPFQDMGIYQGRPNFTDFRGQLPPGFDVRRVQNPAYASYGGGVAPGINNQTGQPLTGAPGQSGLPDWFEQSMRERGVGLEQGMAEWQQQYGAIPGQPGGGEQGPAQEQGEQMPAWMRARLRRNPGGGGQRGNPNNQMQVFAQDGGESQLNEEALQRYKDLKNIQAQVGPGLQALVPDRGQNQFNPGIRPPGAPPVGSRPGFNAGMMNPYANGFEFFNY